MGGMSTNATRAFEVLKDYKIYKYHDLDAARVVFQKKTTLKILKRFQV
jgi:hypothetical protein